MARRPNPKLNYLKKVMAIQTKSYAQENMIQFLKDEINGMGDPTITMVVKDDNIYVTKGKAKTYPCVVSHMDTVHALCDDFKIYHHEDALFSVNTKTYSRTGIGGDDKVGVFICLELLKHFDKIKIAFFKDEEVGCQGSGVADMKFFEDVSFALQADRKGYEDFVRRIGGNMLYGDGFADAISDILVAYDKKECLSGGSTDVNKLRTRGLHVAVANISCGYYKPHTSEEYIIISEVFATCDFMRDVIEEVYTDGGKWEYKPVVKATTAYKRTPATTNWGHGTYMTPNYQKSLQQRELNWWGGSLNEPGKRTATCSNCKSDITDFYDEDEDGYYCPKCDAYRYLPDGEYAINHEHPSDNIVKKAINGYNTLNRVK